MNPWRWVDPRVAQVRPAAARAYLLSRGWRQTDSSNPQWLRFEPPARNREAPLSQVIPSSDNVADFTQSMIYFLTAVSEIEDRHPVEVLNDVLSQQLMPTPRLATTS